MNATLEALSRALGRIDAGGSHATHRFAATDELDLKVKGVGQVRLPVSAATARKLCSVARPARHGYKDQTRLNPRVRDTWEIAKSRVSIDGRRWNQTFKPMLEHIARDLGLPAGCHLEASLHNMLVYTPGQFFVSHQDSEKADEMVATLVVQLPSRFSGGGFLVEHQGQVRRIQGSASKLTFIAFYADCHHEVRPLNSGHRVVLTYNLMLRGQATAAEIPVGAARDLTRHLRSAFDAPAIKAGGGARPGHARDRLVYLLDHEYTPRGLDWSRLKNADAQRAAALRQVAGELDCEIHLTLADVHETWACEDDSGPYRNWGWDEDDLEEAEEDDLTLVELIDSEIELRHWISADGKQRRSMRGWVHPDELCFTRPSANLQPFKSEHEGYMGNWGNTVDRWYHRAAIVLWPRERNFIIRAKVAPDWAIAEMSRTVKKGEKAKCQAMAQSLAPFWPGLTAQADKPALLLEKTLALAVELDQAALATHLLKPFSLPLVSKRAASRLAKVLAFYGEDWCLNLLKSWTADQAGYTPPDKQLAWLASGLPALYQALDAKSSAEGSAVAAWLIDDRWTWLRQRVQDTVKHGSQRRLADSLQQLGPALLGLIAASYAADKNGPFEKLIDWLTAQSEPVSLDLSLGLLRAASKSTKPLPSGLGVVHKHASKQLTARLATPQRAEDDWSIQVDLNCSCSLCAHLEIFLRDPDQARLEWPLAKDKRRQVHGWIDHHDLPVDHNTRRKGSPYVLVLQKTTALFERDKAARRQWAKDLGWLEQTYPDLTK